MSLKRNRFRWTRPRREADNRPEQATWQHLEELEPRMLLSCSLTASFHSGDFVADPRVNLLGQIDDVSAINAALATDANALAPDAQATLRTLQEAALAGQAVSEADIGTFSTDALDDFVPEASLALPDWSTYLGGSARDSGESIATDRRGNVIVAGTTQSAGWTVGGPDTTFNGGTDAFVVKLAPKGGLLWSTFLGGSGLDEGNGVAVDRNGNVIVAGSTESAGWIEGGEDTELDGVRDAFIVKLAPDGEFLWSTYVGGDDIDEGFDVTVDSAGRVIIGGATQSDGWIVGGADETFGGGVDGFVAKFNSAGRLNWSTYVGGDLDDTVEAVDVGRKGKVAAAGGTESQGWVADGFDVTYNGELDGFAVTLTAAGQRIWSTYIGGEDPDICLGVAVNGAGDVHLTGATESEGWTAGGFDTNFNGDVDGFVVKLSRTSQLRWSTYLGGDQFDDGRGIEVRRKGVFVTGGTESSGWVAGGFQTIGQGSEDAFLIKLNRRGKHCWSTFIGGDSADSGNDVALNRASGVFVTGLTFSAGWVDGGFNTTYNGGGDGFVAKIVDATTKSGRRFRRRLLKRERAALRTSQNSLSLPVTLGMASVLNNAISGAAIGVTPSVVGMQLTQLNEMLGPEQALTSLTSLAGLRRMSIVPLGFSMMF